MDRTPRWPQLTSHNAAAFQLDGVVRHYHLRTPYPGALPLFLRTLCTAPRPIVLELGTGTGTIARGLAEHVERVDAVDLSPAMLARARELSSDRYPNIRWIEAPAESAPLDGPYALAVAGDSLHWMDWDVTLPRLAGALAPDAVLAIVHAVIPSPPWSSELSQLFAKYSVIPESKPLDLIEEIARLGLFEVRGRTVVGPEAFERTIEQYVDALHSTASLPRERLGNARANEFDNEVRRLLREHGVGEVVSLEASAEVTWGIPQPGTKK